MTRDLLALSGLLAVLVLPGLLVLLGLPDRQVPLVQSVLLAPPVLWALLVLRGRKG